MAKNIFTNINIVCLAAKHLQINDIKLETSFAFFWGGKSPAMSFFTRSPGRFRNGVSRKRPQRGRVAPMPNPPRLLRSLKFGGSWCGNLMNIEVWWHLGWIWSILIDLDLKPYLNKKWRFNWHEIGFKHVSTVWNMSGFDSPSTQWSLLLTCAISADRWSLNTQVALNHLNSDCFEHGES